MVEEDPKWNVMLENKVLLQGADVMEKYRIVSATEVPGLVQDDFQGP